MHFFTIFFCSILLKLTFCEESIVQLSLRKPINRVSDKYISYSLDSGLAWDTVKITDATLTMAKSLAPAYIRVSENQNVDSIIEKSPKDWKIFYDWIKSSGLKPIFTLNYNPQTWQPRNALRMLTLANSLEIKDCIWQLGSDFNATADKYITDLRILATIVGAFSENKYDWGVIGADITAGSNTDEVTYFTELIESVVEAVGWTEPLETISNDLQPNLFYDKDFSLRAVFKSDLPLWVTLPITLCSTKGSICQQKCIRDGLVWAQYLGDAAKNGFNTIYKTLDKTEILNPSLNYYIALLHKKFMGQKVFDTRQITGDRTTSHFYTHCTRNISGSFSLMGINMKNTKLTASIKMNIQYVGTKINQYILTVVNGTTLLNNEPIQINSIIEDFVKVKRFVRPITFILPAFSIGFWTFPLANLNECTNFDDSEEDWDIQTDVKIEKQKTAVDNLLHELILENIERENTRIKRHLVVKKDSQSMSHRMKRSVRNWNMFTNIRKNDAEEIFGLLQKFTKKRSRKIHSTRNKRFILTPEEQPSTNKIEELFKLVFGEPLLRQKKEILSSKRFKRQIDFNFLGNKMNTLLPKLNHGNFEIEKPFLKSSENPNFPKGDIFLELGPEKIESSDYISSDEQKNRKIDSANEPVVPEEILQEYFENVGVVTQKPINEPKNREAELWEAVVQTPNQPIVDVVNNKNLQETVGYIIRELQPTLKQNEENLQKAKQNLNEFYMEPNTESQNRVSQIINPIRDSFTHMEDDSFFGKKIRHIRSIDFKPSNDDDEKKHEKRAVPPLTIRERFQNFRKKTPKDFRSMLKDRFGRRKPRSVNWSSTKNQKLDDYEKLSNSIPIIKDAKQHVSKVPYVCRTCRVHAEFTVINPRIYNKKKPTDVQNVVNYDFVKATTEKFHSSKNEERIKRESKKHSKRHIPKFMKRINTGIYSVLDNVQRHVLDWWNVIN